MQETGGETLWLLWPEIILTVTAVVVMVGSAFVRSGALWTLGCALGLAVAAAAMIGTQGMPSAESESVASGPIVIDALSGLMRWLGIAMGLAFTFMFSRRAQRGEGGEILGMVLLTVVGVMLVSSATNFVLLFVALELISIPTYVLLFAGRADRGSAEASGKYFLLSIVSSAIFLLGVSLLYGTYGTTQFAEISAELEKVTDAGSTSRMLLVAFLFTLAGLCFKIAAVPFHFYAPDVYSAATNANAGLLAVVPKVAGLVAIVRLIPLVTPIWSSFGWQVALILAVLTMTIGNACALWQTNVRRLLAYSSIAHAGYMLIGVSVAMASPETTGLFGGVVSALFYTFMYCFASIGAFAVLAAMSDEREVGELRQLSGLYRHRPLLAAALGVCMFSLAGIPPMPGFWGKLGLLGGAVSVAQDHSSYGGWFMWLAIVGALNAAVGAAYYLRFVATAFFGEPAEEIDQPVTRGSQSATLVAVVGGVLVVVMGCMPSFFIQRFSEVEAKINASQATEDTVVFVKPTINPGQTVGVGRS